MKKRIIITITLSLISVISVLMFLLLSTQMPNQKDNGFTRSWLKNNIPLLHENTSNLGIERIVGSTDSHLYFSGSDPRWVLMTDLNLQNKDTLFLSIAPTPMLLPNNMIVDSPFIHMYINNISYIISGRVDSSKVDTLHLHTPLFTRSARISNDLLIIRGLDSSESKQVFKQLNCTTGQIGKQVNIIEDRQDGGFSSDGFLQYDSLTKKLIYVQMYQNRFFCLDTNLQLIYTGKTIDTSNTNLVSIKEVKSGEDTKLMPANARQTVNRDSFTDRGYLFVASGLRADNESLAEFNRNTVVDIYIINTGKYIGSFYIPNQGGKKPLSIKVTNNLLIALYQGGHIRTYTLDIPLPKELLSASI
jgi:hypothetical protein